MSNGVVRAVDWRDDRGRWWRTLIPADADDSEAPRGVPVGPPDLLGLGLPEELEVRLHNELHSRGIFGWEQARRIEHIQVAMMHALKLDAQVIQHAYWQEERDA